MPETLAWRIVTASPMDGFLLAMAADLKDMAEVFTMHGSCFEAILDNILF